MRIQHDSRAACPMLRNHGSRPVIAQVGGEGFELAANSTPRYIRGETGLRKPDGIYRASLRGESTYMLERAESVAQELAKGKLQIEPSSRSRSAVI